MAIYHYSTKPIARPSGRSAVAAVAYCCGGEWSRSELWNATEEAEKRKDARTAREWEVALAD